MPSILPQFDATSVHHQGVQKWKATDPTTTRANASDTARRGNATATIIPMTNNIKAKAKAKNIIWFHIQHFFA